VVRGKRPCPWIGVGLSARPLAGSGRWFKALLLHELQGLPQGHGGRGPPDLDRVAGRARELGSPRDAGDGLGGRTGGGAKARAAEISVLGACRGGRRAGSGGSGGFDPPLKPRVSGHRVSVDAQVEPLAGHRARQHQLSCAVDVELVSADLRRLREHGRAVGRKGRTRRDDDQDSVAGPLRGSGGELGNVARDLDVLPLVDFDIRDHRGAGVTHPDGDALGQVAQGDNRHGRQTRSSLEQAAVERRVGESQVGSKLGVHGQGG